MSTLIAVIYMCILIAVIYIYTIYTNNKFIVILLIAAVALVLVLAKY